MRQLNLREERLQRAKASIQKAEKEKRDRGGFGTTVGKGKAGKDKFGKVNSSTGKTNSSRKTKRDLERRLKSIHGSFRHYVLPDDRIRPGLDEEGNEVFRPYADWIDRIDGEEDPNQNHMRNFFQLKFYISFLVHFFRTAHAVEIVLPLSCFHNKDGFFTKYDFLYTCSIKSTCGGDGVTSFMIFHKR